MILESEPTQIVTLIGVILSFIVGVTSLWIGIRNSRKIIFINSITASRIKYIQDLRNNIAEFCSAIDSYKFHEAKLGELDVEKLYKIHQELIRTTYLIKLYLNPEDKEWDTKINSIMSEILEKLIPKEDTISPKNQNNLTQNTGDLLSITQYLLKLEWEGVKSESIKGHLSKKRKNKLYKKHLRLYERSKES